MTLNERFAAIKSHYRKHTFEIIERSALSVPRWHDPYTAEIDFLKLMSPIERDTWNCIREFGIMPLYPQYPVGKYFTDFGNPHFKVAVECDGKEFHKDKEKDRLRDEEFYRMGWTVYRISGSDCVRDIDLYFEDIDKEEKEDKMNDIYSKTANGLIKSLAIKYCKYPVTYSESELAFKCLYMRVSNNDNFEFYPELLEEYS